MDAKRGRFALGMLTGISYVSGVDYFRAINERCTSLASAGRRMKPNPRILLASVDCDEYVELLEKQDWDAVAEYLMAGGLRTLAVAGCDLIIIVSNTGHIAYPSLRSEFPAVPVVHIADCTARALKDLGGPPVRRVGLVGTTPTMTQSYLKDRLALHGLEVIVPDAAAHADIYDQIIVKELSYEVFDSASRVRMVGYIEELEARGAQACILGCTEIELLVKQDDIPSGLPLLASAQAHIDVISQLIMGCLTLADVIPPTIQSDVHVVPERVMEGEKQQ